MNHNIKTYGLLALGWVILILVGWTAYFTNVLANNVPSTIAIVGIGLGCLLTAVVVAITDRSPR
ncbi:hypothetical protein [Nonomuraea sp. NPDC050783]|uniref:hypothetical protein n=1 Tax=Nonomuraea sp. NPDC050783 TaxID=3154634 RepID=UPI003465A723